MPLVPIPSWNVGGLIPPTDVTNLVSVNRAPYSVALTDLVLRFATNAPRIAILQGFFEYRAALHAGGLISGFQWLDGSFVENIENGPRNRPPNDMDVVTFFRLPPNTTQAALAAALPDLFPATSAQRTALKNKFRVDAFTVDLGTDSERLINRSTYWYSLWAHQRNSLQWKGFLQVDLSPANDAAAIQLLAPPPATP